VAEPVRRPLWLAVGLLALAAVVLWVAGLRGGGAALSALAALALAMIAAAVASGGWPRRLLGAVIAAVGVVAVVAAARRGPLPATLGVAGGLLVVAAGGLLAVLGHRMPRMGARYDAKPRTRSAWEELDAGNDPTA
jgi:Tryptophan-associated transmembrane protein (Trp_oprn_chp)